MFTRDLYSRLVQGVSTLCLKHFHKAFQPCVYNTSTGVFCFAMLPQGVCTVCKACTQFAQVFSRVFYTICTNVFERFSQHLYMGF